MVQTGVRGPEKIRTDVTFRLMWDSRIEHSSIHVEAWEHTVVLKGTVPSLSAREYAEDDAYAVDGVASVDNRLTVTLPPGFHEESDELIVSKVRESLQMSPDIDSQRIGVTSEDGVVMLAGFVDTGREKAKAQELASNIEGVAGVRNHLVVKRLEAVNDEAIELDIREALDRTAGKNTRKVEVRIRDGIATLSGTVDDSRAYREAENIAIRTAGILGVKNEIVIM